MALQCCQATELHVQYGPGLHLGQLEYLDQIVESIPRRLGIADGGDDGIQVSQGDTQPLEYVSPVAGLFQLIAGAAGEDLSPVLDVDQQRPLQGESARLPIHQGQQVDAKSALQGGVF